MGIELQRGLNYRHEQIVNWLVCNPHRTLGECAAEFNYTQPWLSQLIHSDSFQAVYRTRCEEMKVPMLHSIGNKLSALAAAGLDEQLRRVETGVASEDFVVEATTNALKALGYLGNAAAGPPAPQVHEHIHVNASDLAQARERAALVNTQRS